MSNRLTIREIAELLTGTTGKSKENIEEFLKEFISVVRDYAFADRLVQIKGIGNFKIIQVEKRESIDVNTKERIVIPEHYKVSFTPDKDMRDVVNKPFALFESIELAADADVSAEEIVAVEKEENIEDDFSANEKETQLSTPLFQPEETTEVAESAMTPAVTHSLQNEPPVFTEIQEITELISDINRAVIETNSTKEAELVEEVIENKISDNYIAEEKELEIKQRIRIKEMASYNENSTNRPFSGKEEYRSNSGNNNTLIILMSVVVVVLIVALVSVLFIAKDTLFKGDKNNGSSLVENRTNQFSLPEIDDSNFDDEWGIEEVPEEVYEEPIAEPAPVAAVPSTPAPRKTIATTVRVERGNRLNLFALKYYGNKVFWVYIYQRNQSKLTDPDNIPVGIDLLIPVASDYQIDANSPASVRKAAILQSQILSSYRRGASSYSSSSYNSSPSSYGSTYGSSSYSYPSYPSYQGNNGTQPSYSPDSYGNQYNSNSYGTGQTYSGNSYDNTQYNQYDNNQTGGSLYDNNNTIPQYNAPAYNSGGGTPYYGDFQF
jgi:nucleoid DNA-binding protein